MARVVMHRAKFDGHVRNGLTRIMRATALTGESVAKTDVLNQPGSGKPYVRTTGGVKRRGVASAPGDPPAPDTGRLRNSSTNEVVQEANAVVARTSVITDYAILLDEGTEKMAPRPFREKILNRMVKFFRSASRNTL